VTTIKTRGPAFTDATTGVASAEAVEQRPAGQEPQAELPATPDLPPSTPPPAEVVAPMAESASLRSIGELRNSKLFGERANCTPLRPGVQSLDQPGRPLDPQLLGLDLHALLVEGAAGDAQKLAAVKAFVDAYPGREGALGAVQLEADGKVTS
jgi:hypothetical protein